MSRRAKPIAMVTTMVTRTPARDSHRRSRPSLVGGIVGGALDTAGLATHGALGLADGIVGSVLGR